MKKVLIIAMMFISLTMFSQKEKEVEKDQVKDLTEKLSESYDSFEKAIAPYIQETLSFIKETGSKAIDVASVEIPAIIKQYLIFEGIKFGLPILLGLFLIFYISRLLKNSSIIESEEEPTTKYQYEFYSQVQTGKWLYRDRYNPTFALIKYYILSTISIGVGVLLISLNLLNFIKVTFLPKLYLVEKFITLV